MTIRQAITTGVERRASEMWTEDRGPRMFTEWANCDERIKDAYRRLARIELDRTVTVPIAPGVVEELVQ